jgi:hypothetical protein
LADNLTLNVGTGGAILATDDVAGVHYQRVKVTWGVDDTATAVTAAAPLPVVQTGTHTVTGAGGSFPVTDSGGSLTVDAPVATPVFVRLSDGAAAISALPVTDNGGNLSIDDGGNSITVDGTVSITANSAVNVAQVGGTNADTNSGVKSAGTLRVVLATDQPALTNKLLVTPDSVALPANQSVNVSQLAGTTTDTNSGVKSAGTLRVVLATDQPALTNKLLVTPDSVALPANQSVNNSQINGVTPLMGNGVTGTGSQRVTIASDNTAFSVNAIQSGTWTVQPGNTANTTPWLTASSPTTSGGLTVATGSITNTATSLKASAGQVYGWYFYNPNATVAYVQFFNTLVGSVTVGTTAPVYSLGIPATSGANVELSNGIAHSTAIVIAITTTRAGSTAPGSSVDYNIYYK